ncbi:acyl-CoA dehydrogenase family protein [Streptomyces sp. NPDC051546]|uniref:acyl-CoA dehydrogenase family protein n=1 Tax=Streptomyces sp. NPDC051546 TaxID=3365655 RepID=UPI003788C65C
MDVLQADLTDQLREFVFDGRYGKDHADLPGLLSGPGHAPRQGLSWTESARRSYRNMQELAAATGRPSQVARDVHRLCALHEWAGVVDPAAAGLMSVHYNLCSASLTALAQHPEYVADLLDDLDRMRSIGLFMVTEVTSGNNLGAIRTRARYDAQAEEFVLESPDPDAYKIMSTSGLPGIARTAVVVAQLEVPGSPASLHAFAVPLATADGTEPGVVITPLSRGMTLDMDFAMTGFHGVRVPRRRWLSGPVEQGAADPVPGQGGEDFAGRFWQTLDCLKLGRVLLSSIALAQARAALAITVRYSHHRRTRGGHGLVPAIGHRNHRAELMAATSRLYAATALMNATKQAWATGLPEPARTLAANTVKVHASYTALDTVATCRERCGAQGLLLHNRISEYTGFAHGAVTAEGDNQVLALALARQLMKGAPRTPQTSRPPLHDGTAFTLDVIDTLLDLRTEALLAEARTIAADPAHPNRFDASNAAAGVARDAALAHCDAQAHAALRKAAEDAAGAGRAVLEAVALHHGLGLLARHGDWYLAEGHLPPAAWRRVHEAIEAGDRELAAHGTVLVDAFGYDDDLLQVPLTRTGTPRPHALTVPSPHHSDQENLPC